MNVEKIERLSKMYETLKKFHKVCIHNDVELTATIGGQPYGKVGLGSPDTQQIIGAVRKATLLEMDRLEETIKEEAMK